MPERFRDGDTGQPLVSVIIPAHDAADYIASTLESVLAQTYPRIEVVVVDDGSSDDTARVAAEVDGPVKVIEQRNLGPAGARNTGIRASTGSIIALLDADDAWMPERLQRCVDVLTHDPSVGCVTTDAYLVEGDTPTDRRYYGDYQRHPFPDRARQLDEIAKRNFVFVSAVFRRSLWEAAGGAFDESLWGTEDYDLWTRFLLTGAAVELVPEPLAWYRVRTDSVSRVRGRQWDAHLTVLQRHLPELWRRGAQARPQDAYDIGRRMAQLGRAKDALPYLRHAVTDGDATVSRRARYALGGAWAVCTGAFARRTPPAAGAAA